MSSTLKIAQRSQWDNEASFRFMDLPLDLRVMVYEFLPIVRRHVKITVPTRNANASQQEGYFILIANSIPPLHVTCRTIYEESRKITSHTRSKILHDLNPPKMVIGSRLLTDFDDDESPLNEILDWCYYMTQSAEMALKVEGRASLINVLNATDLEHVMTLRGHNWAANLSHEDMATMTMWIRHTGWWLSSQRCPDPNIPRWLGLPLLYPYVSQFHIQRDGWLPNTGLQIAIQMQPGHAISGDAVNEFELPSNLHPAVDKLFSRFSKRGLPAKALLKVTGTSFKMREAWVAAAMDPTGRGQAGRFSSILEGEWNQNWAAEDGLDVGGVAVERHARRRSRWDPRWTS